VDKAKSFDADKVAEAHEGMCRDNTHIGRQCIRKEDHQVVMDMHLYQVKAARTCDRPHRRQRLDRRRDGRKDPVEGFTWEIKKKN